MNALILFIKQNPQLFQTEHIHFMLLFFYITCTEKKTEDILEGSTIYFTTEKVSSLAPICTLLLVFALAAPM